MSVADPKCFVRLERPIPGVDHINAVDQRKFAEAHELIDRLAPQLGVDQVNDFYVYSGQHGNDRARWHEPADGLATVRTVKKYIESHESLGVAESYRVEVIEVLAAVERLLNEADSRGIRFCVVGNY